MVPKKMRVIKNFSGILCLIFLRYLGFDFWHWKFSSFQVWGFGGGKDGNIFKIFVIVCGSLGYLVGEKSKCLLVSSSSFLLILRENITSSLCNGFLLEGHIKVIEIMISRGIGTLYYIINFYLFSLLRGLLVLFYCNFSFFLISFNKSFFYIKRVRHICSYPFSYRLIRISCVL